LAVRVNLCGGGIAPPRTLNVSCDGVTVNALIPVAAPTVRLTVIV